MAEETQTRELYEIEGTKVLNLDDSPYMKIREGRIISHFVIGHIAKSIYLKLINRNLRKRFGKSLEEFNKEYRVRPMFAGTPRIGVFASNKEEAIEKARRDEELLNYLFGVVCGEKLEAHLYD